MALLKKLKSSTLMETMVATVLLVIVFMVASLIMNSLLAAQSKNDVTGLDQQLKKLEYRYLNQRLPLPHAETWKDWEIMVLEQDNNGRPMVQLSAKQDALKKEVTTYIPLKQ
ncbi:hypothetical protein [uncultured Croceitalea sp.]|uniref:hypothetical protein n=1 Tax=uncultured Croceitalea sp. TaxID=1798908 RepID=UPI0033057B7E